MVVVSCLTQMLRTKLGSSARTVCVLDLWPTSQPLFKVFICSGLFFELHVVELRGNLMNYICLF